MSPLVLVVEDETILGDAIAMYLERHACSTAVARSGEEGVRLAEEASPDVAVVDVRLPGIDGLEVLRRIREASSATEVVMMTAHASVTSAVQAMKLGAFDYLTKPLDLHELRVVVDKAVAHLRMQRELSYLKARQGADGHVSGIVGDLYYRIKVLTVEVPPLRERGADIPLLARHFMRRFTAQYGLPVKELAPDAETALLAYGWPGNVRELAHVLERALLLHGGPIVTAEQLGLAEVKRLVPVSVGAGKGVSVDFGSGGIVLDEVERELIVQALDAAGWNRTRASRLLGISKETLRYRMEKFRLSPPG